MHFSKGNLLYIYDLSSSETYIFSFSFLIKAIKIKRYKIEVLSVVLYSCETRSFASRGRGSNRRLEESASEELRVLYSSSDIAGVEETGKMIWAGLTACDGEKGNSHSIDQHVYNNLFLMSECVRLWRIM